MDFGLSGLFGSKPSVPAWQDITLPGEQQAAISTNLAALPGLEKLGTETTAFNQDQITQMLKSLVPGWEGISETATGNIQSLLSGKLPTDVSQQVQSSTAAQALTGGFGGSGLAGNLTARDLGLTSLGLTQQGLSSAESWTSMIDQMYQPGQFNISSMFVSPQQMFTDTMENQEMQFSRDWTANQVAAMPDPQSVGLFNLVTGMMKGMGSSGSTGGGSTGGGSTGGGGGGGL